MEPTDPSSGSSDRIEELTRRAADDVADLAREYGGMAKSEAAAVTRRAIGPAAIVATGGVLAVVGLGALLLSPAMAPYGGRMRRLGAAYLAAGAAGATAGLLVLRQIDAFPRTRRALEAGVDAFRSHTWAVTRPGTATVRRTRAW